MYTMKWKYSNMHDAFKASFTLLRIIFDMGQKMIRSSVKEA